MNTSVKEVQKGASRPLEGAVSTKALRQECAWELEEQRGGWGSCSRVSEGGEDESQEVNGRGMEGRSCRLLKPLSELWLLCLFLKSSLWESLNNTKVKRTLLP